MAFSEFNLAGAFLEGKRALELNPVSAITRYAYAQALAASGQLEEGIEQAKEGCEIDPLMAPINYCYGLLLYYQHRWDEAEAQLQRTLYISPNFFLAQAMRGVALARSGRFSEAMARINEFVNPNLMWELLLGYVAALAGDRDMAESVLARRDSAAPAAGAYFASIIHGALGQLDEGFTELERARDLRFGVLGTAAVNPSFDPFRSDPRWAPFLQSMNFGL